ncbi:MAG: UDP-N-acetylglucosamine 1-carboxyvinyltransferase [Bacillota bacterium]
MGKFIVLGGSRLEGKVRVSGSKNAVLPILAASLLNGQASVLHQVPELADVFTMKKVLESLGAKVNFEGNRAEIETRSVTRMEVPELLTRQMRASNLVMGPLLGRFGYCKVSYPGGCEIGSRPMDLHLKGFKAMGAVIQEKFGYVEAECHQLKGADIHLDFPSVGATENLMMAAVFASGQTIIRNAAKEPEIVDLQNYLNRMGAKIKGAGLDVIRVQGVSTLHPVEHAIIPDRIEGGTFMVAAAISNGDVIVENVIPEHLEPVTAKLREAGAEITNLGDALHITCPRRVDAVDVKTMPYPGFPTDMQPQMVALLTKSQGTSIISESIFENRFKYVDELRRMGAQIKLEGRVAIVTGVPKLTGAIVEATDLRAGAALVIAALAAQEATVIENVEHIERGYEKLEKKLNNLGARVMRVNGVQ